MNAEAIRSRIVGSLSADANVRRAAELELKAVGRILFPLRGVVITLRGPKTACSTTEPKSFGLVCRQLGAGIKDSSNNMVIMC